MALLKYNGIDRVNPALGYVEDNVVTCCKICNIAKHDLRLEEFLAWIEKLKRHNRDVAA